MEPEPKNTSSITCYNYLFDSIYSFSIMRNSVADELTPALMTIFHSSGKDDARQYPILSSAA